MYLHIDTLAVIQVIHLYLDKTRLVLSDFGFAGLPCTSTHRAWDKRQRCTTFSLSHACRSSLGLCHSNL